MTWSYRIDYKGYAWYTKDSDRMLRGAFVVQQAEKLNVLERMHQQGALKLGSLMKSDEASDAARR